MTLPRTKLVGVICVAVGLTLYGTWVGWLSTRTDPASPEAGESNIIEGPTR